MSKLYTTVLYTPGDDLKATLERVEKVVDKCKSVVTGSVKIDNFAESFIVTLNTNRERLSSLVDMDEDTYHYTHRGHLEFITIEKGNTILSVMESFEDLEFEFCNLTALDSLDLDIV